MHMRVTRYYWKLLSMQFKQNLTQRCCAFILLEFGGGGGVAGGGGWELEKSRYPSQLCTLEHQYQKILILLYFTIPKGHFIIIPYHFTIFPTSQNSIFIKILFFNHSLLFISNHYIFSDLVGISSFFSSFFSLSLPCFLSLSLYPIHFPFSMPDCLSSLWVSLVLGVAGLRWFFMNRGSLQWIVDCGSLQWIVDRFSVSFNFVGF